VSLIHGLDQEGELRTVEHSDQPPLSSCPISVVVTNYNTAEHTLRCVDGVARFKGDRPVEMVVVDDASTEPIQDRLPSWVTLISNPTNHGYVRSVNIGVRRTRGDVVLLLDSDATPLCDVFTPIATAFSGRPGLGALGFHLVDRAGDATGATAAEPTALGLALGQPLEQQLQRLVPSYFGTAFTIHSCAVAFRRSAFDRLGGFDEEFDFLDADTDFSMRLRRAGWELDVDHEVQILHEGGGSPQSTSRRVGRFHANRWRLLMKHGLLPHPRVLKAALATRHAAELLLLAGPARFLLRDAAIRADKIRGRRHLLARVWRSYRDAG
jgi:GT2 family glycosyltransferase